MTKISMFTLLIAAFSTGSMYPMKRFSLRAGKAIRVMAQRAHSTENNQRSTHVKIGMGIAAGITIGTIGAKIVDDSRNALATSQSLAK